jgi:hypothetical protein
MNISRRAIRYISMAAGATITTAVAAAYLIPLIVRWSFAGDLHADRKPLVDAADS